MFGRPCPGPYHPYRQRNGIQAVCADLANLSVTGPQLNGDLLWHYTQYKEFELNILPALLANFDGGWGY